MLMVTCILGAVFLAIGLFFQIMAKNRLSDDEFRKKGFVKVPSGWKWVPFLLRKNYAMFNDSQALAFFEASRFCLLGMLISFLTAGLLMGSEILLNLLQGAS